MYCPPPMPAIVNRPSESVRARCGPGVATTSTLRSGRSAESRTTPRKVPPPCAASVAGSKTNEQRDTADKRIARNLRGGVDDRANWGPDDRELRATGTNRSPVAARARRTLLSISRDRRATMSIREDLELLDQTQHELDFLGEELEETHGIDRRDFVFWSLVTAAASTFGFGASALAQAPAAAARCRTAASGAASAARQRRAGLVDVPAVSRRHRRADGKAHQRARRRGLPARDVRRPAVDRQGADRSRRDRVPPSAPSLRAHQGPSYHVDAAHADLPRPHQAAGSDAALRRHDHGRPGDGRSGKGRRRPQGGQVSRPAARHPVRREGPLLGEGRAHDVGLEGFREPRHR